MKGRHLLLALAAFAIARSLHAEAYPAQAIRMVVPYAAGGGVDSVARPVAAKLSTLLDRPVVVDNRAGASGDIGANMVAKATPDGYTLLVGATFLAFNRATSRTPSYDAASDLVPVARIAEAPLVLVVPATSAYRSVADLVGYVRAHPDRATYGAVGAAAPATLLFVRATGARPVQVLYKGGAAAMPDLIAGRIDFMIQTSSEVLPLVRGGKLRALAVTGPTRFPDLPSVPTMKEAGVPGLEIVGWWGLFAPARTPPAIIDRLSGAMQTVLADPAVTTAFARLGVVAAPQTAEAFRPFYDAQLGTYADIARRFDLATQ